MKSFLMISLFTFSLSSIAAIRVMTFNTTCSICNKGKFDKFRYRKKWILDTIKRADPDLISLQEILLPSQLIWFKKRLRNYKAVHFSRFLIFKYPDPTLFIKKSKFKTLSDDGFWFGRRHGRFSFGWKTGLPRRTHYAELKDKATNRKLLFAGSHFDNNKNNKHRSAQMLVEKLEKIEIPIIFAADTNLKPSDEGYATLLNSFTDTYDSSSKISFMKNSSTTADDSCNIEKGKTFPDCRVDHIMTSRNHRWNIRDWVIDQYKYGKNNRFTSDHRALYVDLEFD